MVHNLRRFSAKLLLSLSSFILCLLISELAVRYFFPRFNVSGQVKFAWISGLVPPLGVPNTVSRQTKNTGDYDVTVAFNKYGFRDDKDIAESTTEDLFVVGDSFAWGWGVEEGQRFSNILQSRIQRKVYNISSPSADIAGYSQLIQYAERHGAKIKNLIICITMENDLRDYNAEPAEPSPMPDFSPKYWLSQHSSLYFLAATVVHRNKTLQNLGARSGLLTPNYEGIGGNQLSKRVLESSVSWIAKVINPFSATVVIIPSRGLWVGNNQYVEDQVHTQFVQLLKERGLNVVDLRGPFEQGGHPLQYHFANDGHWNPLGHVKAAEILALRLHRPPLPLFEAAEKRPSRS